MILLLIILMASALLSYIDHFHHASRHRTCSNLHTKKPFHRLPVVYHGKEIDRYDTGRKKGKAAPDGGEGILCMNDAPLFHSHPFLTWTRCMRSSSPQKSELVAGQITHRRLQVLEKYVCTFSAALISCGFALSDGNGKRCNRARIT